MAKLIHASALSNITGKGTVGLEGYQAGNSSLYNNGYTELAKNSIIFTDDGYIVTKGIEYYIGVAKPGELNSNSGILLKEDGKTLEIYDSNGNKLSKTLALPVYKLSNGNLITVSNNTGNWTVSHNVVWNGSSYAGATADSSDSIIVPDIDVDAYGHISKITNRTATLNKVKSSVLTEAKTLYLLGHSEAGTAEVKYDTSVYFTKTTGTSDTVTLTVPLLTVTKGGTGVTLGTGNDAVSLQQYIADRITANDAMVFKGTIGSSPATIQVLPLTTCKQGWTYKVSTAGWIKTDGTFTTSKPASEIWQAVEVGDMVMCITDGVAGTKDVSNANWTIVLVNIDGSVVTNELTSNGIAYATGNNTIGTISVGTTGLYLRGTSNGVPVWADFKTLSLFGETYEPYTTALTITCGAGLSMKDTVLGHSTSVTDNSSDAVLYKLTYDSYGHINKSKSWDPLALTFSGVLNNTDGKFVTTYTETLSTAPIFDVDDTTKVTTLAAGRGIVLYGNDKGITIGHKNKVATTNSGKLGTISFDEHGHITGLTEVTSLKNPHSLTIAGIKYDGSAPKEIKLGSNLAISGGTINATNTWRPVLAYLINSSGKPTNNTTEATETTWASSSTSTDTLIFSKTFSVNSAGEIDLAWAEVDSNGNITYSV